MSVDWRQVVLIDTGNDTAPIGWPLVFLRPFEKSILAMNITANRLAFENRLYLKIVSFGADHLYTCRRFEHSDNSGVCARATADKR